MLSNASPLKWDIAIVGAGVLGVTLAYWLSSIYDCRIVVVDRESRVAMHASSRNTGVVHRPFYLNPKSKTVFAKSAELSYGLWKELAISKGLPWLPSGTMNVAVEEEEIKTLEKYSKWGEENGLEPNELQLLSARDASQREPEVRCLGALLSRSDASVDFGTLTRAVMDIAVSQGVTFLGETNVESVLDEGGSDQRLVVTRKEARGLIACDYMINAAGGGALKLAHSCNVARQYTNLSFRGEYWQVEGEVSSRVRTNIYRPPRYPKFPFLDPHFVIRADGIREVGPNAVLVTGPYVYSGFGFRSSWSLAARPVGPKARLLSNFEFLRLVTKEARSSLSKNFMAMRVAQFIPRLRPEMLTERGTSGIRSSIIDSGGFVPEAVVLHGRSSIHIMNYNSPGATGAPSYSAMLVSELGSKGLLAGLKKKVAPISGPWQIERALGHKTR